MAGVFALLCIFFMYVNIIFMSVVKKNASLRDEGGVGLGQGLEGHAHTVGHVQRGGVSEAGRGRGLDRGMTGMHTPFVGH